MSCDVAVVVDEHLVEMRNNTSHTSVLYFKEKQHLSFCSGSDRISNIRIFTITLVLTPPHSQ